jgi:hypothetical protein
MSETTFAEVMAGQYEPPQDWVELHLDTNLRHLEPQSGLGALAMETCGEFAAVGDYMSNEKQYMLFQMYEAIEFAIERSPGRVSDEDYALYVQEAYGEMEAELDIAAEVLVKDEKEEAEVYHNATPSYTWEEVNDAMEEIFYNVRILGESPEPPEENDEDKALLVMGEEAEEDEEEGEDGEEADDGGLLDPEIPEGNDGFMAEREFIAEMRDLFLEEAHLHFGYLRRIAAMRQAVRSSQIIDRPN